LIEVPDRQLARTLDTAVIRSLLPDDQAEDGGLARAIGTNESNSLSGVYLKRGIHKEDLASVLLGDVRKRNHFGAG
jgi:hypothetical protein